MKTRIWGGASLLVLLSACGAPAPYGGIAWDGRRGYDGSGDYGYDPAASRAEAGAYRAHAARRYTIPGPPEDPWGPHIREAATRFGIPETWVREVMRQESGGRLYASDGSLITSGAGAMGLMQVMPGTYDRLRRIHRLGSDPYEPRDNILAGAAYLREMHDRFGSPYFLAAYNAGPERVELYLAGAKILPDETENYVASIAPRLGGSGHAVMASAAYAPAGGAPSSWAAGYDDPANRAYEGGGLVTPDAPTGSMAGLYAGTVPSAYGAAIPVSASYGGGAMASAGRWGIQVGAYPDPAISQAATAAAQSRAGGLLGGARAEVTPVHSGGTLYRARLVGLSAETATAACATLSQGGMPCFTVPPTGS